MWSPGDYNQTIESGKYFLKIISVKLNKANSGYDFYSFGYSTTDGTTSFFSNWGLGRDNDLDPKIVQWLGRHLDKMGFGQKSWDIQNEEATKSELIGYIFHSEVVVDNTGDYAEYKFKGERALTEDEALKNQTNGSIGESEDDLPVGMDMPASDLDDSDIPF